VPDVRLIALSGNAVGGVVAAVVVVGSFGLLGLILTARQRSRRAADKAARLTEMESWAQARGWSFTAEDPALAAGATPGCFELEHPAKANHVWARDVALGTLGFPSRLAVQVAEWERTRYVQTYNPNGGSFATTEHNYCSTARVTLSAKVPTLAVVPRGGGEKSKNSVDEPITGYEAFDSGYRVVLSDPAAQAVMSPQVFQWQIQQTAGTGWRIAGTTLEVWADGHLSPAIAEKLIAQATSLVQLLSGS
jgi:hypothetical protein